MTLAILFWILMIIWAVFGFWGENAPDNVFARRGRSVLIFVLFAILGWAQFGGPVH